MKNCRSDSELSGRLYGGRIENCYIRSSHVEPPITAGMGAVIYNCTLVSNGSSYGVDTDANDAIDYFSTNGGNMVATVLSSGDTPPDTPPTGYYRVVPTGQGAWTGLDNHIVYWNGGSYDDFRSPVLNDVIFDSGSGQWLRYDGSTWVQTVSIVIAHSRLDTSMSPNVTNLVGSSYNVVDTNII